MQSHFQLSLLCPLGASLSSAARYGTQPANRGLLSDPLSAIGPSLLRACEEELKLPLGSWGAEGRACGVDKVPLQPRPPSEGLILVVCSESGPGGAVLKCRDTYVSDVALGRSGGVSGSCSVCIFLLALVGEAERPRESWPLRLRGSSHSQKLHNTRLSFLFIFFKFKVS